MATALRYARADAPPWQPTHFAAALIDLDGTLVDTVDDFVVVLQRMMHDLPLPFAAYSVQAQTVMQVVGKGSQHLVRSFLQRAREASSAPDHSISVDDVYPLAWQRYQQHYQAINGQHARVYAGVEAGLQRYRAWGWKMVCVTNKPHAWAVQLLHNKGLAGYFEQVFGGDSFARKKPDPLPLVKACESIGVQPAQALMIGDSSNDAQAARAAGCPVLLVDYGYNHGQPIVTVDADAFSASLDFDC
jgi:phosphoglycolate phosphatase